MRPPRVKLSPLDDRCHRVRLETIYRIDRSAARDLKAIVTVVAAEASQTKPGRRVEFTADDHYSYDVSMTDGDGLYYSVRPQVIGDHTTAALYDAEGELPKSGLIARSIDGRAWRTNECRAGRNQPILAPDAEDVFDVDEAEIERTFDAVRDAMTPRQYHALMASCDADSFEEVGTRLGVSRVAAWKLVQKARAAAEPVVQRILDERRAAMAAAATTN